MSSPHASPRPGPSSRPSSFHPPASAPHSPTPSHPPLTPFFTLISPTPLYSPQAQPTHIHPRVHYIFSDDAPPPPASTHPSVRTITVTLDSNHEVVSAESESADFMVTSARVGAAPVMGGQEGGEGGGMVVVEGVEVGGGAGGKEEGVEGLLRRWEVGMEGLGRVVAFWGQGEKAEETVTSEGARRRGKEPASMGSGDDGGEAYM